MQLFERLWRFFSASAREHHRERPEVLLRIEQRSPDSEWRAASFSIRNMINQQLLVTEIALSGSIGCRIAPAIGEFDNWRIDKKRIGRTFLTNSIIHANSGQAYRQEVPFYLRHPRGRDGARYSVKVAIRLEHLMDRRRRWRIVLEGQLPQSSNDPQLFDPRGAHVYSYDSAIKREPLPVVADRDKQERSQAAMGFTKDYPGLAEAAPMKNENQRSGHFQSSYPRFPSIIGALIIAVAILLSTLIFIVGTRYVVVETSNEDVAWLVDRLSGDVYKCRAGEKGKALCVAEKSTGTINEPKR